jgi:hypothetical protein
MLQSYPCSEFQVYQYQKLNYNVVKDVKKEEILNAISLKSLRAKSILFFNPLYRIKI